MTSILKTPQNDFLDSPHFVEPRIHRQAHVQKVSHLQQNISLHLLQHLQHRPLQHSHRQPQCNDVDGVVLCIWNFKIILFYIFNSKSTSRFEKLLPPHPSQLSIRSCNKTLAHYCLVYFLVSNKPLIRVFDLVPFGSRLCF